MFGPQIIHGPLVLQLTVVVDLHNFLCQTVGREALVLCDAGKAAWHLQPPCRRVGVAAPPLHWLLHSGTITTSAPE